MALRIFKTVDWNGIITLYSDIKTSMQNFFLTKEQGEVTALALTDLNIRVQTAEQSCTTQDGHYTPDTEDTTKKPTNKMDNNVDLYGVVRYVSNIKLDSKGHIVEYETSPTELDYDTEETDSSGISFIHIWYSKGNIVLHIPFESDSDVYQDFVVSSVKRLKYGYLRYKQNQSYGLWSKCEAKGFVKISSDSTIELYNGTGTVASSTIKDIRDGRLSMSQILGGTSQLIVHHNKYKIGSDNRKEAFVGKDKKENPNLYDETLPVKINISEYGSNSYYIQNTTDVFCDWFDFYWNTDETTHVGANSTDIYCRFEFFDYLIKSSSCTSLL